MKVILNQAVPKLGKEGQVVTVADGYARNFLFPRGMAILAQKNQIAALERRKAKANAAVADRKADAESKRDKVNGATIRIPGKVGADGARLFGAITNGDVSEALKSEFGLEVDRKQIALVQPIKRLGEFPIRVDLHPDVEATVNVVVFDPNAKVEEAPVETTEDNEDEA